MNRQESSAAAAIGLLYLIRMLGLFMVLPVLPLAGADVPGATPLLVGVAIGIYGLSQGALQIPFGLLSDRFGRKPVIAFGLGLFILGSFVAAVADHASGLIAGRFLQGCGAVASTLLALLSDLTRVDQRAKSMAIIGVAIAASFGLALILGPLVAGRFGVEGIFHLSGLLGLGGLALLIWLIPSPRVMTRNLDASVEPGRLLSVLKDLGLWRLNASVFFLHYLLVSAFSVYPLLFVETGRIGRQEHALYYLGLLAAAFLLMLPFMWLADRVRDARPTLMVMVGLCFLSFFLLRDSVAYYTVLAAALLFFMAFSLLEVILPAQVSKLSDAGGRGTSMGVYTSCQFLGIFAGGLVSGWILSHATIAALMYVNMGLLLAWFIICATSPKVADLGSRTVRLDKPGNRTAQQDTEALLSLDGVIDAVIIEAEQVAYLKVDEQVFEDRHLDAFNRNSK